MPPDEHDAGYLWDMLATARLVASITDQLSYEGYLRNRTIQLAVERAIEIIGEAARNVSRTYQDAHPQIPWRPIVAQRHVLAHEYGEIKHDRIWRVVTVHIPELIGLLEPLVPPAP